MATSPITFQIGNGVCALRRLIAQAQRIPPPTQGKPPGARQAEFVICD
jgi:hypothetical protein